MQMVATSYSLWTDEQPASVPYQPASPSWHSLEGLIKYQTKANFAVGHLLATWQEGGRRKWAFQKCTERRRVKETPIVEVTSSLPAAVTGKQTGS